MKILAVDTAAAVASAAVMDDFVLLGETSINHRKTHSQKLMPMIECLLSELELMAENIDIFAASSGPGSFTGLRIGVTTMKAIAFACGKPMVSVPTLDALACNINGYTSLICPIMDARNNQVYTALYKWEKEKLVNVTGYMGITIDELTGLLKGKNQEVIFNGDGVALHRTYLQEQLGERCSFALANNLLPRAASVAYAASVKAVEGQTESCFSAAPFYLRKSQAEREMDKKAMAGIQKEG